MADQPKEKPAAAPEAASAPAAPKKGGPPIKTIAVVLVMLIAEAALIVGVLSMVGKPSDVKAVEVHEGEHTPIDKTVEISVLADKFMNNASGRVWVWDAEVYITAKERHAGADPDAAAPAGDGHGGGHGAADAHAADAHGPAQPTVRDLLKQRTAEIRTGISAIFSSAQHTYFTEPGRETLSRQILDYLRGIVGQDEKGEERIQSVLIPKCMGYPADY